MGRASIAFAVLWLAAVVKWKDAPRRIPDVELFTYGTFYIAAVVLACLSAAGVG